MRITIDLSAAVRRHGGLGRYAHELTAALVALDRGDDYQAFLHSAGRDLRPDPPLDRLPVRRIPLDAKPWRMSVLLASFAHLPLDAAIGPTTIFHGTDHLLPPTRRIRTVFTVHDLIFRFYPEHHLPLNRWYLTLMMPRFLRAADALIAVSEQTKRDVVALYGVPAERIHVIYEGVASRFQPVDDPAQRAALRQRLGLPERFLLYLGTIEPRKNLIALLDAYQSLVAAGETADLVIAGRRGWLFEPVFAHVRRLGLERRVHFLGWVEDADTPTLLSAARAFVFPSLYEGFGLPPLEAMACGTPVVASNTSSLPEVVGDAGLLVPPTDRAALAAALRRVLADDPLVTALREKGLRRARRFRWEKTALETLAVYRTVAGGTTR
ncbi:MAG: glycosyltransferase family 1 protein [Chloroflexota bacterium]|nr:glycosyltransferase family 4 protein [Dehalococcoidia bacterium]MDW8255205.1 glycosyltransferase family 1 protein [Chloroflexota bacterium]